MWCGFPSRGIVSAVQYAFDVCGDLCHLSAHAAIAASLVAFCWLLMVWGSMISSMFVVWIASSASCFALLKPSSGAFLGSHSSTMLVLEWDLRMTLNLLKSRIDSSWSPCGDASRALLTAAPEGSAIVTKFDHRAARLSRK